MPESKKKSPKSASESVVNKRITRSMSCSITTRSKSSSSSKASTLTTRSKSSSLPRRITRSMSDETKIKRNSDEAESKKKTSPIPLQNMRITRSMSKTIPDASRPVSRKRKSNEAQSKAPIKRLTKMSVKEPLQIPIPVQKYRMIRHTSDTMSDEDRIRINRATLEARRKARLKYVNKHFGRDKDVNERGCIRIPLPETQHLKVQTDLSDQSRLQFLNKLGVVWDTDIHRPCQGVQLITAKDVEMFEAKLAKLTKKFEAEKAKQVNKFEPEEACIPRTFAKLKNPKEKLFKYEMLQLCARLATREYNNLENTAYQFVDIEKAGYKVVGGILYYIIFQAKAEQSETFETIVFRERNGIEKGSTNHVQRVRINRPGSIWHDGTLKEDVIDRI